MKAEGRKVQNSGGNSFRHIHRATHPNLYGSWLLYKLRQRSMESWDCCSRCIPQLQFSLCNRTNVLSSSWILPFFKPLDCQVMLPLTFWDIRRISSWGWLQLHTPAMFSQYILGWGTYWGQAWSHQFFLIHAGELQIYLKLYRKMWTSLKEFSASK